MNTVIELLTRLLSDTRPQEPADGAYLYCQTIDNQQSVFGAACSLVTQGVSPRILILEADAMSGYPGGAHCREQLQACGLPAETIHGVPAGKLSSINTLIESEALVRYSKQKRYGAVYVVSSPFHQLRAFMTAVTVAQAEYPQLSIYSYPGSTLPWMDAVVHSQGTLQAPRRQLIQEELTRIDTYQKKGDLARFERGLKISVPLSFYRAD
jgi:hypothetical protein